ncbi:Glutamate Receptor Ionotropic, Nmda 3A [Manis pentadactyla]|nr:Glutamate Receptor Ionotropic, Nmda 3A [Manis pentadactyla]
MNWNPLCVQLGGATEGRSDASAGQEGQHGTDGHPGPRLCSGSASPATFTPAPRTVRTRAHRASQAPPARRHKGKSQGPRRARAEAWNYLRDGGGAPPATQPKQGFSLKDTFRTCCSLRAAVRCPAGPLPPHSPVSRGPPGQPKRSSEVEVATAPKHATAGCAARPAGPARALALPGARPGQPPSLPCATRPARQAPGLGSAAALTAAVRACAAHPGARRQAGRRCGGGARESRGADSQYAGPGRDHPLPAPGVAQLCCAAAGPSGLGPRGGAGPPPRTAPGEAAAGTAAPAASSSSRPLLPQGSGRSAARPSLLAVRLQLKWSWHEVGKAYGTSSPRGAAAR